MRILRIATSLTFERQIIASGHYTYVDPFENACNREARLCSLLQPCK
jgi:hypothetical protein